jgi:hypothetical protein
MYTCVIDVEGSLRDVLTLNEMWILATTVIKELCPIKEGYIPPLLLYGYVILLQLRRDEYISIDSKSKYQDCNH